MRKIDPFLLSLIGAVVLASFFPCSITWRPWLSRITYLLIGAIFFLQGVKLKRTSLIESIRNWKLQGGTLLISFVVFPCTGFVLYKLFHLVSPSGFLGESLWKGILFLCCLPSTIQSSIALTSIAKGNVSASICAATLSNILGIFITPLVVSLCIHHSEHGDFNPGTIVNIVIELLVPFIAGQVAQPWLGAFINGHTKLIHIIDRLSVVLLVYAAFSVAVIQGVWHLIPPVMLFGVGMIDVVLLFLILTISFLVGRISSQKREDTISLQFCGSKKALTTGVTMASIIFPDSAAIIVLPLMIFHQIQLFGCTIIARYYSCKNA